MNVDHRTLDALTYAVDLAAGHLRGNPGEFDEYPFEYWVREWLPDVVMGVVDQ